MNPPHDTLPRTKQDVKTKIDAGVPTWEGGGGQTAEDSDICPQEDCVGKRELADPSCFFFGPKCACGADTGLILSKCLKKSSTRLRLSLDLLDNNVKKRFSVH